MATAEQRSGPLQAAQQPDKRVELVGGIEAARTGQHPDARAFEALGLLTEGRYGHPESMPIRAQAKEGNDSRSVTSHFGGQALAAGDELARRELGGAGGGARHPIGQAAAAVAQDLLLRPMPQPRGEPGAAQRRPRSLSPP